jgi:hypothetical protein
LLEVDWEGGAEGVEEEEEVAELLEAGFDVVPGVDCSSLGRSDAVVDSGFGGAGAEEEEELSAGISREEITSSGSARTAILAPTWMPFAPSCSCDHILVWRSFGVLKQVWTYDDLCKYPIILCLNIHCCFVCLDLQYHISGGELVACNYVNPRSCYRSHSPHLLSFSSSRYYPPS